MIEDLSLVTVYGYITETPASTNSWQCSMQWTTNSSINFPENRIKTQPQIISTQKQLETIELERK